MSDAHFNDRTYQQMIQPEEEMDGYQQDQDQTEEDSKGFEEIDAEIEVNLQFQFFFNYYNNARDSCIIFLFL